jgi:hypothetical protein
LSKGETHNSLRKMVNALAPSRAGIAVGEDSPREPRRRVSVLALSARRMQPKVVLIWDGAVISDDLSLEGSI